MEEKVLVINGGSSSLKFQLYNVVDGDFENAQVLAKGLVERIGLALSDENNWNIKRTSDGFKAEGKVNFHDHREALDCVLEQLTTLGVIESYDEITAVGHRILHGKTIYKDSVLIDDSVIRNIRDLIPLAPNHHLGQLKCIDAVRQKLPNASNVAVFDTAFHQTMPDVNYTYALPKTFRDYGIRKYGFHGTSHKYITKEVQKRLGKENVNIISCHIGSGESICCVKDGKSYDTTMGMTPTSGLVMGMRCGDVDPTAITYIMKKYNISTDEMSEILSKKSGAIAICGANDYRDLLARSTNGDKDAQLAMDLLHKSVEEYIVKYMTELQGDVDAIVFTAGIGENSKDFRKSILDRLSWLGISYDETKNAQRGTEDITAEGSRTKVFVIPTDEEKMILMDTYQIAKANEYSNGRQFTR